MKKGIALILTAVLLLTGCSSTSAQAGTQENTDAAQEEAVVTETEAASTDAAEKTDSQSDTQEQAAVSENADTTEVKEAEAEAPQGETGASSDTLVLYFSRTGEQYVVGVIDKGNTAIVAEMIAEQTGADRQALTCSRSCPLTTTIL